MAGSKPGNCSSRSVRNTVDMGGTRKPHFFKVIAPPSLTNQKGLSIPPKFVKEYGKRLSNPGRLVVPSGVIWEVELVMGLDNNLWFRKGWLEFARFFSIQYGHFLVFRYEGTGSLFRVFIFDTTATEIEYQSRIEDQSILRKPANVVHIDDDDELVDRFLRTQDENRVAQTEDEEDNENDGVEPIKDGKDNVTVPRNRSVIAAARHSMEAAALVRRDSGIPSFTVTARRSSVSGPFTLTIPRYHVRLYLQGQDAAAHEVVHLQSADDTDNGVPMTWSVKCRVRESPSRAYFQSGWKEFVLHHRILVGDVCVFQLVHRSPPQSLYMVTIFKKSSMDKSDDDDDDEELVDRFVRTQEDEEDIETEGVVPIDDDIDQVTVPRNRSAVEAARLTVELKAAAAAALVGRNSGIPSFTVTVPRLSVSGKFILSIPTSYYREYLMGQDAAAEKVVHLQSADDTDHGVPMTWSVKYRVREPQSRAYFQSGWKEFVLHHRILAGDICVFQLVHPSPSPSLYKVTILKKSSMDKWDDSVVLIDDDMDQVTVPRNRSAVAAARQTVDLRAAAAAVLVRRSGISSFTVTAPRSSVSGKFTLSIPTSYYREYLMGQDAAAHKVVLLQSADDAANDGVSMTWSVKYGVRDEKSYAYFQSGWKEFVLHHHIRAGDVCVFHLVHRSPPPSLYKVTILKKSSMSERRRMQA